jgi:hypothetical protein
MNAVQIEVEEDTGRAISIERASFRID